jgi:hypothetical protein
MSAVDLSVASSVAAKKAVAVEAKAAAAAARTAAKEAETAAKEERRKERESIKAAKAALPKKPRGRPRKNPLPASPAASETDMDNMSAHSSVHFDADSDSEIAVLRTELSSLKARYAALEIAYQKTAHTMEAIRSALAIAAL